MDTIKQPSRFLAMVLSICMLFTMLPVGSIAAFAAGDADARSGGTDVLIFSTYLTQRGDSAFNAAIENIPKVFEEKGYTVQEKLGIEEENHLTEEDMEGIGLLILFFPYRSCSDEDIALMREFLQGGGRIVMIGEHGRFSPTENMILTETAEKLGGNFQISTQAVGRGHTIAVGSAEMPKTPLTENLTYGLYTNYVAPISYAGSVQPVLYYENSVWAVDQAVEMGRILAISDINCFDPLREDEDPLLKADTEQWILNWLLDARNNQRIVAEYRDPNLGFGGSPAVTVTTDTHFSVAGDYSFTVTYEAQGGRTMDAQTIGTDDVTVTDADGNELVIGGAQIIDGEDQATTTVRYTVEAQNPGIFTPGAYTISIVNAGVADSGGYQVGGKTKTFQVSDLPVEITGPENVSVPLNGSASLSVSARVDGAEEQGPFNWSYQWYRKTGGSYEPIEGAEDAVYQIPGTITGQAGEYVFRCECTVTTRNGVFVPIQSKDAVVTVQRGVSIGTPTASDRDGMSWSLSAELLEAGSEPITETGFVWGIMGSPTLALNNGQAKTAAPVTEQGGSISVTADDLATGVSYYARAYAKTAGGSVTYSAAVPFGNTGDLGSFSVTNNGDNTFTVTLTGGKGEQMVYYRTVNGSAVGGTHFEHQSGVLIFAPGETSKTITVTEYDVNSVYDGNAATGYANTARTYSLELYRTMGGASISTAKATRTMNQGQGVDRDIFGDFVKTVAGENHNHGDYDDDKLGWTSGGKYYPSAMETVSVTNLLTTPDYWRNLTTAQVQFRMYFEAAETNDGYQHIQIASGNSLDLKYYPYDGSWHDDGSGNGTAARYQVTFEHGGDSKNGDYRAYGLPANSMSNSYSNNTETRWGETWLNGGDAAGGSCVVLPNDADSLTVGYAASGGNADKWTTQKEQYKLRVSDTREPQLLAVAPMAQTAYAAGENITIALIFDEIVDSQNSKLSNVSIETNLTGTLSYADGADTNVLYFTGQVTSAFNGGEIQVNKINGTEYIKDMSNESSTPTGADSSKTTNITLGGASAPTVSIDAVTVNETEASATVTAQNASVLKYCWTTSPAMPAAGWLNAEDAQSVTLINTMTAAGTYYLHAMAINTATGAAAYASKSFTINELLYLEVSADNTSWAQSRTIMLESSGEGNIEVKTPGGETETLNASVTSYTAVENGTYTFTLRNGERSVEKQVVVERIDRTAPTVSFGNLPEGWQQQFPNVTVSGGDGNGAAASGITSLKYKLVTEKGEYPAEGLQEVKVSDGKVNSQTISGEGADNGLNYIYYIAQDAAGNTTQGYSSAIRVDDTTPTITVKASVSEGSAAMFEVTATFGISGGDVTFWKQSEDTVYPVSGNTQKNGDGSYTLTAAPGVSEEGTYRFTVTTGAGKTATVTAPEICRITLNANNGSFDPEDPSANTNTWLVVEGGRITPPEGDNQQAPERKGYTLKGWYTGSDLQTEYDSTQTVSGTMTLYAGWELNTYTIGYELDGGSFATGAGNPDSYTVEDDDITLEDPSKDGYIFLGWSGTELEEIQQNVVIPKGSVGNRSYTANWTQVTVSMEGWTYGDAPKEPAVGEGSNPGGGEVTYTYYTDAACTTQTTPAENGAEVNGGKPIYAGTYYVKAEVAAANGYNAASGKTSFTIQQKTIGIRWEDTELTYTGKEQAPTAAATGLVEGDSCNITVTGAKKDTNAKAGNESYTATAVSVDNGNYKLPEEGLTQSFTIAPAVLEIAWSDTELTYNGNDQKPTATPSGMINGEDVTVTVSGGQVNANQEGTSYTATASVSDKNYVIKEGSETTSFTIKPKTITEEMVSLSDGILKGDSYEYAFTKESITPAVAVSDGGKTLVKETDYILSGDTIQTAYGDYTLTVEGRGNYTGTVEVKWNITDPNTPAATISVGTNGWNTFWNTVTFGLFFKETQSVTVSGTDGENESGVKDVFYYTTEDPADDIDELSGVEWTEIDNNGSFNIEPNQKLYIYAKVTDHAGNTVIVNSDGIVVYTDAEQETEELMFTRLGDNDLIAAVKLNGNTIDKIKCGDSVLIAGKDYMFDQNAGSITLRKDWLKTLAAGEYTLTVSYNPMGVEYVSGNGNDEPATTSIALSVQKAAGSVTNLSDISKIYDGSAVSDVTYDKLSTGDATVEYKVRGADDNTYTTIKPTDAGEYTVRVTVAADDDYTAVSATANFEITYLDAPNPAYTLSGTEGTNDWYTSDVTITPPECYTVSSTLNGIYSDTLTVNASAKNITIYLKNEKGQMTDAISVVEIKIDKDDPSIAVTGNTTDYLTDDTVKITASDSTSGIAKVEVMKDNGSWADITNTYLTGYPVIESGTYTFRVTDNAGRTAQQTLEYENIDTQKPVVTINATHGGESYTSGVWTNKDITLIPQNETGNLGTTTYQYRVDGGDWQNYTAPIVISTDTDVDGILYEFKAKSASGVESEPVSITVKRDTAAPSGVAVSYGTSSFKEFLNGITFELFFKDTQTVTITAVDTGSGVKEISYKLDSSELQTAEAGSDGTIRFNVEPQFVGNISGVTVTDNAGNSTAATVYEYFAVDAQTPGVPTVSTGSYTSGEWTDEDVTITVSGVTAGSGIAKYQYSTDNGASWQDMTASETTEATATTPPSIDEAQLTISDSTSENGTTYLFRAVSNSGMEGTASSGVVVKIDKTQPAIAVSGNTVDYLTADTVTITPQIGGSGIASITVSKDNGEPEIVLVNGDGAYTYTVDENGIYTFTLTNGVGVTVTDSITYTKIDGATPVVVIDSNGYTDGAWTNSDVTLEVANSTVNLGTTLFEYRVDNGQWKTYSSPLTVSSETDGTVYTFRATSEAGVVSAEVSITVKLDKTAPDGDIEIEENSVKAFINAVTFGLFYNENVDISIISEDAGSGVQSTWYYRSENILTEEQVAALTGTDWKAYTDTISVTAADAETFVYYVKIIDNAGNETCFASNGATFDLTEPVISGVTNQGEYYTNQTVQVTDDNLDTVTLNGSDASSEITLAGNVDADTEYIVIATDKAGNTTTVTVTMKPTADLGDAIEGIDPGNVNSSDKETIEDYLDDLNTRLEDENLTNEEKKIIQNLIDDAQDLLNKIDEVEQAANTENLQQAEDITADNVKPEDKEILEAAKDDVEKVLEEYGGNYTEDEKAQLEETLQQIEDVLDVIQRVEDVEEGIGGLPENVSPDDIEAAEQINAAKEQYDALSEHGQSLISDEAIDKLNDLLAQLGDYRIIEGDGSTWTKGNSEGLTFVANGAYSKFTGVEIDGVVISAENYMAVSGSTKIVLTTNYLSTLTADQHNIAVLYMDGEATGTFTIAKQPADEGTDSPQTGDDSHIVLWIMLMLISGGAVLTLSVKRRNKKT